MFLPTRTLVIICGALVISSCHGRRISKAPPVSKTAVLDTLHTFQTLLNDMYIIASKSFKWLKMFLIEKFDIKIDEHERMLKAAKTPEEQEKVKKSIEMIKKTKIMLVKIVSILADSENNMSESAIKPKGQEEKKEKMKKFSIAKHKRQGAIGGGSGSGQQWTTTPRRMSVEIRLERIPRKKPRKVTTAPSVLAEKSSLPILQKRQQKIAERHLVTCGRQCKTRGKKKNTTAAPTPDGASLVTSGIKKGPKNGQRATTAASMAKGVTSGTKTRPTKGQRTTTAAYMSNGGRPGTSDKKGQKGNKIRQTTEAPMSVENSLFTLGSIIEGMAGLGGKVFQVMMEGLLEKFDHVIDVLDKKMKTAKTKEEKEKLQKSINSIIKAKTLASKLTAMMAGSKNSRPRNPSRHPKKNRRSLETFIVGVLKLLAGEFLVWLG